MEVLKPHSSFFLLKHTGCLDNIYCLFFLIHDEIQENEEEQNYNMEVMHVLFYITDSFVLCGISVLLPDFSVHFIHISNSLKKTKKKQNTST